MTLTSSMKIYHRADNADAAPLDATDESGATPALASAPLPGWRDAAYTRTAV